MRDKMEVISELMTELEELMQPSGEDFGERLGRPKVEVAIESDGDVPMDGEADAMDGDFANPDHELKERLLKLRG